MRYYTVSQWLIFFFIYCFLGWVWECCYVSVRKRKWVNRGFLHGPFLPIYGSGAIVILISTIAVKDIVPLVFLAWFHLQYLNSAQDAVWKSFLE